MLNVDQAQSANDAAKAHQETQDTFAQARFVAAVNEGIAGMSAGTGRPVSRAFQEIRAELGL